MRVLLIAHEKNLGGASRSMINLIDALKGKVEFFVVLPYSEGEVAEELKKRGVYCFYFPMKWWFKHKDSRLKWIYHEIKWHCIDQFINIRTAHFLKKIIKDFSIDLIHTNVSVINVGGLLHRMTGIPHIWHIREFGQEDMDLYPVCSKKKTYGMISESSTVITVSKSLKEKYEGLLDGKIPKVVYNGVGTENYISLKEKPSVTGREVRFLITGHLSRGKGQSLAIKAADILISEGETDFILYIAGRGDKKSLESLKAYKRNVDHIVFLGQVDNMPECRKNMDVELVCSRSEAFGRVTAEAMMSAMPVIGSDSGGTPELIEDGVTGFLFSKGDVSDLAEKMKYFLHYKEGIYEMGEKAQQFAMTHFTKEIMADNIYKEYKKVYNVNGGGQNSR